MAKPRSHPHLLCRVEPKTERFRSPRGGTNKSFPPPPDRAKHADRLESDWRRATKPIVDAAIAGPTEAGETTYGYLEILGRPGVPLDGKPLDTPAHGVTLTSLISGAVSESGPNTAVDRATIRVDIAKRGQFTAKLAAYRAGASSTTKSKPRNANLFDRIDSIRPATLESFWTDDHRAFPTNSDPVWWEVWLLPTKGRSKNDALTALEATARSAGVTVGPQRLSFREHAVLLVHGTVTQLRELFATSSDLAEVRGAPTTGARLRELTARQQREWVDDLVRRIQHADRRAPAVCILDTGVNRAHPLLEPALDSTDCCVASTAWKPTDESGHGTQMAGIALFGDLAPHVEASGPIVLRHRLESAKLLRTPTSNDPEAYGATTASVVHAIEAVNPSRARCFSMAITVPSSPSNGQPTSWSAVIDGLACGYRWTPETATLEFGSQSENARRRLIVVSAGNVDEQRLDKDHLKVSDEERVQDPAQAWNALTVGACTSRVSHNDQDLSDLDPVAEAGELSPWSTTSVEFHGTDWPIKPDLVFEGGNVLHDGDSKFDWPSEFESLTTHHFLAERFFALTRGSSSATAEVARMAAMLHADYPKLAPETIRALLVHSAEWTKRMWAKLRAAGTTKEARERILRRYGFGVPDLERARRSASNALTLIVEGKIHPFREGKIGEAQFFTLPWPKRQLGELADATATLRVTLSYFIEPHASRRARLSRYTYPSHRLCFDVNRPEESLHSFRERLNKLARPPEDAEQSTADPSKWFLGTQRRHRGSLHSDFLFEVPAVQLANQNLIGIYPVGGWWKERKKLDRSALGVPFSLVVSISTEAQDVDLWTPVSIMQGIELPAVAIET
jgi:hypothetical protein